MKDEKQPEHLDAANGPFWQPFLEALLEERSAPYRRIFKSVHRQQEHEYTDVQKDSPPENAVHRCSSKAANINQNRCGETGETDEGPPSAAGANCANHESAHLCCWRIFPLSMHCCPV